MQRVVSEFLFGAHALGHITVDDDQFLDVPALVLDGARRRFQNPPVAILVPQTVLQIFAHAGRASFAGCLQNLEAIVGMNLFEHWGLGELAGRVAEHALIRRAVVRVGGLWYRPAQSCPQHFP